MNTIKQNFPKRVARVDDRPANHPMIQLRNLRKQAKLQQADLAKKAGVSREALVRGEVGSSDLRISTLMDLAGALGYEIVLQKVVPQVIESSITPPADKPLEEPTWHLNKTTTNIATEGDTEFQV